MRAVAGRLVADRPTGNQDARGFDLGTLGLPDHAGDPAAGDVQQRLKRFRIAIIQQPQILQSHVHRQHRPSLPRVCAG